MRAPRRLWLSLLLLGCGVPPPGQTAGERFSGPALATVTSQSGALQVEAWSDPQPAARGENALRLHIEDAQGRAMSGLSLTVRPWMVEMGHGTSAAPVVTEEGAGRYEVTQVFLAMPGRWQLRTEVTGAATDAFVLELDVP